MSATQPGHDLIWAWREEMGDVYTGAWAPKGDPCTPMEAVAYIRADVSAARIADLERQLAEARTDAELAVALVVKQAADLCRANENKAYAQGRGDFMAHQVDADAILALAPADALAEVDALKAERDGLLHDLARLKDSETHELNRAEAAEAEVARLSDFIKGIASRSHAALITPEKDHTP